MEAETLKLCALAGLDVVVVGATPRVLIYCDLPNAELPGAAKLDAPMVWLGDLRWACGAPARVM